MIAMSVAETPSSGMGVLSVSLQYESYRKVESIAENILPLVKIEGLGALLPVSVCCLPNYVRYRFL